MKTKKIIYLVCMLFGVMLSMQAHSQAFTATGCVKDGAGIPMPGVSIQVKGTTTGTATNAKGEFSLKAEVGKTLVVSFVGYAKQEVSITGTNRIDIVLQEDSKKIDEVVVVGYGTQKKVNMTGSVSSVKFDDLVASRPITNVSSALSGLSSGVTIRQSSGKPGSDGASIRIRGTGTLNVSDPLVIIDGMEGSLDALNPQDIESVSILKDAASASIYGSRAANGVILVTTKKGSKDRISVTYNGVFSIAQPNNLLDFVSDYPTYMKLMNESARNINAKEPFRAETISLWENANKNPNGLNANGVPNYVAFPNTDWNKEMYKNNLVQDHTLSVSGATKSSRFLISAGYLDNPGLVENTGTQRYSMRTNLEIDANKWLTIGTRTFATVNNSEMGNYSEMLNYISQSTPGVYGVYNGRYGAAEAAEESQTANNPYNWLYKYLGDNKVSRLNSTLYSKVKLAKGLTWDVNFNYSKRLDEYRRRTNPNAGERVRFGDGTVMSPITQPKDLATYYNTSNNYSYTFENILRYEKTIGEDHNVGAILGYNESYLYSYYHSSNQKGLIDESVYVPDMATEMLSIGGTAYDWALKSFFGRLNYSYKQRYLLEANFRRDESSKFAPSQRVGTFPSFSVGWRISEESFIKDLSLFQNLKLRASWGKLGNNATGRYKDGGWVNSYYDYMSSYKGFNYSFNGKPVTALAVGIIGNNLLEWESTTVSNIGLDASILDGRLTAELDFYNKVTDGILTVPPIPFTLGLVDGPIQNTAEVTNRGAEVTLGWKDKIGQVNYSISGNVGYNHNEVTKFKGALVEEWRTDNAGNKFYYSNLGDVSDGGNTRVVEGHMINEYRLMEVYKGNQNYFNTDGSVNIKGGPKDGMIRTPDDMTWLNAMIAAGYTFLPNKTTKKEQIYYGDYIYADINGDGVYGSSATDRRFTGNSSTPKFTFGSQMSFSWKNVDLNLIWSGQAGGKLYWLERGYNNSVTRSGYQIGELVANDHYYYNDVDPKDPANNVNATYPRLKYNESDSQNTQPSTRWLYDASYLRLKNLTVGYTLPQSIVSKASIQQVRLYFSAENLFTITSYPGLDPEMGANSNYPLIRQIAFGANITF